MRVDDLCSHQILPNRQKTYCTSFFETVIYGSNYKCIVTTLNWESRPTFTDQNAQ